MSVIQSKFIPADAVNGSSFKLANAQTLRARNAANNADVALFSLTAADLLVFNTQPTFAADPVNANDLARKSWIDTQLGNYQATSGKGAANGYCGLDANSFVPLANIPPVALERLVIVADQAARFALTTATVQNGDTVKQTDTGAMYFVKDQTQLGVAAGYEVYTAGTASSIAWSGVTGTPTTLAGYGITDYAAAAKAAAVADSITNGVTDVAPSQNAVFDALALKADATAIKTPGREVITLVAGDITNGYIELAHPIAANSLMISPKGGLVQEPGVDFTESIVVTNTRVTFAGDLLLLAAGDKLICSYMY